jgi:hypothetical protein
MASQIAEITLRRRISARSDSYYDDTKALGDIACEAFRQSKAQIRNLENIANSAVQVTDILDFVKRQTGRSKPSVQWCYLDLGQKLLNRLDESLRKEAQVIFDNLTNEIENHQMGIDDLRRIHLFLCREFIRHLSAHYLYHSALLGKSGV